MDSYLVGGSKFLPFDSVGGFFYAILNDWERMYGICVHKVLLLYCILKFVISRLGGGGGGF